MTKAFLRTGNALFDTEWRVVLVIPKSQYNWVYDVFYGLLVNAADEKAWITGGESTPTDAAAIFEQIIKDIRMFPSAIGFIFDYPAETAPLNCLACDGAEYDRADYPDLYDVLDPVFLTGPDTFITPDLRDRYRRGLSGDTVIGETMGADVVNIDVSQMPSHQHSIDGYIPGLALAPGELPVFTDVTVPSGTGFTGGGADLPVIPASLVLLPCIVAKYP